MITRLKQQLPEKQIKELCANILQQAMIINRAKAGNLQIVNEKNESLEIISSAGLSENFLEYFNVVKFDEGSICGRAFKNRETIFVEDLVRDELFAPHLKITNEEGIRSVQSTPLISSKGKVVGMISTHFKLPKFLVKNELNKFESFCEEAANIIEHYSNQTTSI